MEGERQPHDDEAELRAEMAAIWARFKDLLTTLTQARAKIKDVRQFVEACGYGDDAFLAEMSVMEIYIAGVGKKLARISKIYEPEKQQKGDVHLEESNDVPQTHEKGQTMDQDQCRLFRKKGETLECALGSFQVALLMGLIEERLEQDRQFPTPEHEEIVTLQALAQSFQHRLTALGEEGDGGRWTAGPTQFALLIELIEDRLDEILQYFSPGYAEIVTLRVLSRGFQAALAAREVRVVPLVPATDAQIELVLALLNAQPLPPERPSSAQRPTDQWMQFAAFLAAQGQSLVFERQRRTYRCQPIQPEEYSDDPQTGC